MARRSKVDGLPPGVLDDLNGELIARGFSGYEELAAWLKTLGYDISKSALHRHGSALEAEFEEAMADARRTRAMARAARESGDADDGALLESASGILQDNLLRLSLKVKNSGAEPEDTAKTLSLITRAFADIGRFDIARQKWQSEVRAKAAVVADSVEAIAKRGGLTGEMMGEIRSEILGIAK
jgi:hypothetical protein